MAFKNKDTGKWTAQWYEIDIYGKRKQMKEIKSLKSTPLWKKLWEDIKPKPRYSRWYKWEGFLVKVSWIMIAVIFAVVIFVGNYYLLKYARIWNKLH